MNGQYEEIYQQAERLHYRFRDVVDQPDAPEMQRLRAETKELLDAIESDKKPRSIEDLVKRIMSELDRIKEGDGTLMDSSDADELRDEYEDLRQELQELPNY
ncbi:MAG TPA: hypothetical protein VK983_05780 [Candidatus Limnocylindrales bacterium]|nr:hypothetical protein [Candidatus Limnocylindrales bacterium]